MSHTIYFPKIFAMKHPQRHWIYSLKTQENMHSSQHFLYLLFPNSSLRNCYSYVQFWESLWINYLKTKGLRSDGRTVLWPFQIWRIVRRYHILQLCSPLNYWKNYFFLWKFEVNLLLGRGGWWLPPQAKEKVKNTPQKIMIPSQSHSSLVHSFKTLHWVPSLSRLVKVHTQFTLAP
jgi:hypothetical protein